MTHEDLVEQAKKNQMTDSEIEKLDFDRLVEMAKSHWTRWRPKMCKELMDKGVLNQKIEEAADKAQRLMLKMTNNGIMYFNEAREFVFPNIILLSPEEEVLQKEREEGI